ncbi:MAG: DUF2460 domain-containing protein, partial [Bryobacteraceae bacterium]
TSGNTIVAILGCDSGPATLSSIHDSNGTVTAASAYGGAGSHPGIGVYFVSGAAAGTHTLTGTWSIAEAASLMLLEFSGLGAFDVAATRADSPSNGTTATSNSLTPSQSGDLVLFAAAWQAGGEALTIGAGFSNSGSVTPAPSTIWGSNAQSNTNPVSGSATASVSDPWAAVIVAFKSVYGDLVANDQIRMSGNSAGTSAAPTGLILNADGTFYFTAGNTPANFYASAYDSVNNVWGPYALQTVASGNVYSVTVNEAGAAADVPNGGNNFSASINEQGLALSFPSSGSSGGAPVAAPALNIFPTFAGIGWPVTFSPLWNNQIQKTVTGRAVAVTYQQFALYTLKVQFSYLSSNDFNNLMGFFNIQGANLTPFLFDAGPGNDSVVEEGIGQGDGSTQVFQLLRSFGGYVEPVAACFGTCTAYVNGSPVTAIFNNPVDGYVTLNSAAAAGTVVSWSGQYYLKVRFSKGSEDIDEFVSQLYSTKSIQLETFW